MTVLIILVTATGAWFAIRPFVAGAFPELGFVEFPVALALISLLAWIGLRPKRRKKTLAWRKHEQVIRRLSDPAMTRDSTALRNWVDSGGRPDEAARALARAGRLPEKDVFKLMSQATSRHKREALLKRQFSGE